MSEFLLHVRKLALCRADLVPPLGRHNDAAGIFRVLAEAQDISGDAHHRLHEQAVQREIDERSSDDRDDDGEGEHIEPVTDHGGPQRRLGQHDIHLVAGQYRFAQHANDAILPGKEHSQRIPDQSHA